MPRAPKSSMIALARVLADTLRSPARSDDRIDRSSSITSRGMSSCHRLYRALLYPEAVEMTRSRSPVAEAPEDAGDVAGRLGD